MILDLEAGIVPRTSIVVLVRVASRVGVRGHKKMPSLPLISDTHTL